MEAWLQNTRNLLVDPHITICIFTELHQLENIFSRMASKMCKNSQLDASDVFSHGSFSVAPVFPGDNSSVSTSAFISKWVPTERPEIPLIGRPLAFEFDSAEYSLLSKPSCAKKIFKKPQNVVAETRKMLMFADRFYEGASQIKTMTLNNRSSQVERTQPLNQAVEGASGEIFDKSWESPVAFETNNTRVSAEEFCKEAVEQARSLSQSWRRRRKKLTAGGMPADKTGLLAESTRLRTVAPPRLHPLKHELIKSARPLKDETSNVVDELFLRHDYYKEDSNHLRAALTSSGLYPSLRNDPGLHSAFETEKCFESPCSSLLSQETITSTAESLQSLGIFNAPVRECAKASVQSWTPRRAKTPDLKLSSSFSEPLKVILKGAYDRRASDAMFCQLYLNEHVKNFESSKIAEMTVPESMQQNFIAVDSLSPESKCAQSSSTETPTLPSNDDINNNHKLPLERFATTLKPVSNQIIADKMGRPPAKPNMAREHIKMRKETIRAGELASIPRHKRLEWSALTPEEVKQKQKAKLEKMVEDLNMPEGCWEVASWFR